MQMNVVAPINSLGYGVVGLNTVLALERAAVDVALWPIGGNAEAPDGTHAALQRCLERQGGYDPLAPSLRIWHQFDLAGHVGKGLHCALPVFELNLFRPNELHHLLQQDIVFAPSAWAAEVLLDNGVQESRIQSAPFGADPELFYPLPQQSKPGDPTTFINVGKWEVRKGHDVLVDAFNRAFAPTDNVQLVMHCHNPCFPDQGRANAYNSQWARMYKSSRMGQRIFVSDGRMKNQADLVAMMRQADCGVFPSRAEGWNLEAGEMLALGKHLIVTDYSAHQTFCTRENSLLIDIGGLEDAHDGVWFNSQSPSWGGQPGQWASLGEPQVEQLVEHLRLVHRLKQDGKLPVNSAGVKTMQHFTWDNTAREILSVLER